MQDSNQRGVLPPHVWDGERDPALPPVRLVSRGDALGHPPRRTLSASLAFGGANAALLFARE
jgi:3-oxoacyl-[acyl-carrier-protein] synthase-1